MWATIYNQTIRHVSKLKKNKKFMRPVHMTLKNNTIPRVKFDFDMLLKKLWGENAEIFGFLMQNLNFWKHFLDNRMIATVLCK